MANIGGTRTRAELFHTSLNEGTLPGLLRYSGTVIGDAAPAASEVFLNEEEDSRFYLPTDSTVVGQLIVSAWNLTDGDDPAGSVIYFMAENDGGTVNLLPADFNTGTPVENPSIPYDAAVAGVVATVVADNVNKSINVNFTPTANDTYKVAGTLTYSFASAAIRNPNYFSVTN